MKTPKSFGGLFGVLNISMFFIVLLYVGMGFFGYWRYGSKVEPSVTLNLPPNEWLAKSVNILYSIAIFISYGLQGYVPVRILWDSYILKRLEGSRNLMAWEYLLRISSVLVTCKHRRNNSNTPTSILLISSRSCRHRTASRAVHILGGRLLSLCARPGLSGPDGDMHNVAGQAGKLEVRALEERPARHRRNSGPVGRKLQQSFGDSLRADEADQCHSSLGSQIFRSFVG